MFEVALLALLTFVPAVAVLTLFTVVPCTGALLFDAALGSFRPNDADDGTVFMICGGHMTFSST